MRFMVLALALFLFPIAYAAPMSPRDDTAIHAVIEDFRSAIVEKDKAKFLDLFLHDGATWQAVTSDERLAQARSREPGVAKAAFDPGQGPEAFIDGIVRDPKRNEETFANVSIDTDGDAASVGFDFTYVRDGRVTNAGREFWLLVRTDAGWKIAAVVFSRNTPAADKLR